MADLVTDSESINRILDSVVGRHRHGRAEYWIEAAIVWLMFGLAFPLVVGGALLRAIASSSGRAVVTVAFLLYSISWILAIVIGSRQELVITPDRVLRAGPFPWQIARADIAEIGIRRTARSRRPALLVLRSRSGKSFTFPFVGDLRSLSDRFAPPN